MGLHKSKNQSDLLKAIIGLGVLLLLAGAILLWVGRSPKKTFEIPETATGVTSNKAKRSFSGEGLQSSRELRRSNSERQETVESPTNDTQFAMQLVDLGQWQDAETLLQGVIAREPDNVEALLELAMIQIIDKHSSEAARPFLERAFTVDPGNEAVVIELVSIYEQGQNWAQAYEFFNGLSPKEGGEGAAYIDFGKGSALLALGRAQEAADHLQKAVYEGAYKDYTARESLATAYEDLGRHDDAIAEYEQVINGDYRPEQARVARIRMANAYVAKGDLQQARSILEPMLQQDPKDRWVAKIIQQIDARQGR